ncbi:hypothetical protein GCM10007940_26420 [Portibacter lacus]|uniref:Secretion system C-terminal sorting domain-containing protein n=1 Tax=Portibacter lacus TaxID=1099794 RepID=A0AA37WF01_9BACT|nr:hypothetical protein GCM10007940_26420 [Portibacter lacus]
MLENERKSAKIGWLKKRLLKLKYTIESRIDNYRLTTKKVVNTAFAVTAMLATAQAQNFELQLNPANPFYEVVNGGNAKPHFVDFDGDGDDDLFLSGYVFDKSGSNIRDEGLTYFENTDGAYTKKSVDMFPDDLGLTEIAAELDEALVVMDFIDYDNDGDLDAFAGIYEGSAIVYLENTDGNFAVNTDANPFAGVVLSEEDFYDFALGDFNGDDVIDAIVSDEGTMKTYHLDGGVFVVGDTIASGTQMSPNLIDHDGDGDLDLMVGNKYGSIDMYENTDGAFTIVENHGLSNVSIEYNPSLSYSDVNNDGDLDVVVANVYGVMSYFENIGNNEYEFIPFNEKGIHFYGASAAIPEFADLDGDGDEDLLVGVDFSELRYVENTEDGFVFNPAGNPFGVSSGLEPFYTDPNCGDIDGDGDIDCHFISTFDGYEDYFENVEGVFTKLDSLDNPIVELSSENNRTVLFEDYDDDGDLDVFIGNKYGEIMYYENVDGEYVENADVVAQVNQDDQSQIYFLDVDNDGDREMIQVDYYYDILTYEKVDGVLTPVSGDESLNESLSGIASTLSFVDIDNDGDEDILFSDYRNRALFVENLSLESSTENLVFSNETRVSPNPASNEVKIDVPWAKGSVDVLIYNFNGQLVKKISQTGQQLTVNTSDLSNGNYTLNVVGISGQAIKKLTIIK